MNDRVDGSTRSAIMRSVRTKNTGPEIYVRRLLFSMGYRFRVHVKDLPGRPDIVFAKKRKIIFVHGCFWHSHGCSKGRPPKSNLDYWTKKLTQNKDRDARNVNSLEEMGWRVLTIWQCELKDEGKLKEALRKFLDSGLLNN